MAIFRAKLEKVNNKCTKDFLLPSRFAILLALHYLCNLIKWDFVPTGIIMKTAIMNYTKQAEAEFCPKAVLFDMDGVLFNSMPAHAKAWSGAMRELGINFREYDVYMNEGRTGHATINDLFQLQKGREATEEEKQRIYRRKSELFDAQGSPDAIPDIHEVLQVVQEAGWETYIVTGSGQPSLFERIERVFPHVFAPERMVTAFDVKIGKPDPEPYLKALQKAGVQPHEAMVVENAPLGVRSAKAAGIFTLAVNTGVLMLDELKKEGADRVLNSMKELAEDLRYIKSMYR